MFIVLLSYKQPLEIVDQYLVAHRLFLDDGYAKNILVASGPLNPRTGGVLISQSKDRSVLENFIQEDPFYKNEVADYKIIEFTPVKHHVDFARFI